MPPASANLLRAARAPLTWRKTRRFFDTLKAPRYCGELYFRLSAKSLLDLTFSCFAAWFKILIKIALDHAVVHLAFVVGPPPVKPLKLLVRSDDADPPPV